MATAEFSKFAGILSAALSQHHLSGFETAQMQSTKTRPGADCGSDHKFFIAKFRLKLKKVGETTRPFRYDLNQSLTIIQ